MSSHDDDTSQSQHIPLDLTIEIFSKLPARSIGRFRSVSNLWSTITTSQYFINSFTMRSLAARPSVLIFVYQGDKLFVFSSTLNKNSSGCPLSCVGSYQFPNPDLGSLERYHSLHGLIFLVGSKKLVIWNPTMKEFFTLPEPQGRKEGECHPGCILGYDPIYREYIVLRVLFDSKIYSKICIRTMGALGQVLCRIITKGVPKHRPTLSYGGCTNGVMYYSAIFSVGTSLELRIVRFDIRSEKFNSIKFPMTHSSLNCRNCRMVLLYEGRIAIVKTLDLPTPSIDLWILKNGDRHEWTYKRFVLPLADDMVPKPREELRFCGVSDAGELIFAPWRLSESFYILYFDPRINSIRKVLCERTL
ncbi:hypothetical protein CARUB_v10021323mg, partial [Capsella rubella]